MKRIPLCHRVRILPLGDSLTQGDGNPSAYRYDLFRLLSEADIPFRYVGALSSADHRMPKDYQMHSSIGGITSEQIISYLSEGSPSYNPKWVQSVRDCEVVLLYIGTNDVHRGLPPEEFLSRIHRLLDLLYGINPEISAVYIATMRSKYALDERKLSMNAQLLSADWEAYRATYGREVHTVDFNGKGTPRNLQSDYPIDDAHPGAEGNRKLAEMWYRATHRRLRELCRSLPQDEENITAIGLMGDLAACTLRVGESRTLSATVLPRDVSIPSLYFESSDTRVARVNEHGRVVALSEGECDITVNSVQGGLCRAVHMTVSGRVESPTASRRLLYTADYEKESFVGRCEAVRPEYGNLCVQYPHWDKGTLSTAARFTTDGGFALAFGKQQITMLERGEAGSLSIAFGGVSLAFTAGGSMLTLTVGGVAYHHREATPSYQHEDFLILCDGERVRVLRDGAELFAVPAARLTIKDQPITLEWREMHAEKTYLDGILLYE